MTAKLAILAPMKAWGGIERKMVTLCKEFLALGVQPELILTRGGQIPYPDEFPPTVPVVDLGNHGKPATIPRLVRHLRGSRPDALLTAKDHAAIVGVMARRLGRLDTPVFVKITNTLSQTLRRPAKRFGARFFYPWADKLIAVSEGVKEDLIANFGIEPGKIEVIYNPTVPPDLQERVAQAVPHSWLQSGDAPVLLAAGRLTPQKDFITLIEAFARVRKGRVCRLIILGEGGERSRIEVRARDLGVTEDVALPGYVADPLPWMARASLFVLSSRYEGLPNALIEALAAGTPVVSTNCPSGAAEILEGGKYGVLVPVGDPQALAQAIERSLGESERRPIDRDALMRFESRAVAERYLRLMGLASSS